MGRTAKLALILGGVLLGVVALAVSVLMVVSSPAVQDRCTPAYVTCVAAAGGMVERIDCRIELYHCRREGPEHEHTDDGAGGD